MQMKVAVAHIVRKVKLTPPTEEVSVQGCDSSCYVSGWMEWMEMDGGWVDVSVAGVTGILGWIQVSGTDQTDSRDQVQGLRS